MGSRRKGLAASFVMTFAAGCDAKGSSTPVVAPTADVPPVAPGASSTTAAETASGVVAVGGTATTASPPAGGTPTASPPMGGTATTGSPATASSLPPAPTTGHVMRRADGTCTWFADVHCPRAPNGRIVPCNPPPPHAVRCPEDAGP
jgi:hypothetical protein